MESGMPASAPFGVNLSNLFADADTAQISPSLGLTATPENWKPPCGFPLIGDGGERYSPASPNAAISPSAKLPTYTFPLDSLTATPTGSPVSTSPFTTSSPPKLRWILQSASAGAALTPAAEQARAAAAATSIRRRANRRRASLLPTPSMRILFASRSTLVIERPTLITGHFPCDCA
ncbi:MAG: hypothetical protein ACYCUM_10525 [Solirubrobacteraceae bacterium]